MFESRTTGLDLHKLMNKTFKTVVIREKRYSSIGEVKALLLLLAYQH